MNIYLDTETLPVADASEIEGDMRAKLDADLDAVRAPSNYKDAAKIEEYCAKARGDLMESHNAKVADAIAKTSFDGTFGRVCCIGFAFDDAPARTFIGGDEREIIGAFFGEIADQHKHDHGRTTVIGHNVANFDLRFLWQRAVINGIRPAPGIGWHAKPWSEAIADTMLMWSPDPGKRIRLDRLCRALGIKSPKVDFDGSMVAAAWEAGEYEKIAAYCRADVDATRACYRRMI